MSLSDTRNDDRTSRGTQAFGASRLISSRRKGIPDGLRAAMRRPPAAVNSFSAHPALSYTGKQRFKPWGHRLVAQKNWGISGTYEGCWSPKHVPPEVPYGSATRRRLDIGTGVGCWPWTGCRLGRSPTARRVCTGPTRHPERGSGCQINREIAHHVADRKPRIQAAPRAPGP